jgi:hypothetical protein
MDECRMTVERTYPHLTEWVMTHGWIEIGQDDYSRSFVRALDIGGMVWEGRETYASLDDTLQALDTALGAWMKENFGGE